MEGWEQPHWSGKPQPKPDTRPRLKPNVFARLARMCASHRAIVFVAMVFLCALAASFAAVTLRIDPAASPRIVLDARTQAAQDALDRDFPGIDETFVARIELADARAARATALAIAVAFSKRNDLFAHAFVPGTGTFYAKYGILFRDTADVEARVALAVRMQPLYHALGAAPDIAGLAALVTEIGHAVAEGRSPPGLSGLLLAASATVEGEIKGVSRPIRWPELAGLSAGVDSTRWFVIATPLGGKERAAVAFAAAAARPGPHLAWYFPPGAHAGNGNIIRDLIVPAAVAALVSLTILGMGLGRIRYVMPVVMTLIATLCLTAGAASLIRPALDAVSWSFAAACVAPAYLFSVVLVLAHIQSRLRGSEPMAALMLAAQRRGPLLLALAAVAEILWLSWLPRQLPSLAQTAAIAATGIAVAFAVTLTLVPAALAIFDREGEVGVHWLDAAVAQPLGYNLRNGRQLLVLVLVAASVFCGVFVPGLRFGDVPQPAGPTAALDTPAAQDAVHLLTEAGDAARATAEDLAKLPETGAIRWVEQFLPTDTERKLQGLRQLDGLLAGAPTPRDPPDAATLATAFGALETGLGQIAEDPATAPDLREAAHRLRRAFGLFANPEPPTPARVTALEDALFSGLGELSWTADQLAKLDAPRLADLDEGLRRRFVSAGGRWRIEVLPKPGVSRLAFAAAMRKFSPQAAGAPIVALARNEIMHHETALAVAIAFAAVAAAVLLFLRNVMDWILSLLPVLFGISLVSAVIAGSGRIVVSSALAAAMTAMAVCLSTSMILVLRGRRTDALSSASDTSFRAALLPPLALLGTVAPLAISTNPAVAAFGLVAALFLCAGMAVSLIIVPQACAWANGLRRR